MRLKQLVKDLPPGEVLMSTDAARPTKSTRYRTARTIGGYGSSTVFGTQSGKDYADRRGASRLP